MTDVGAGAGGREPVRPRDGCHARTEPADGPGRSPGGHHHGPGFLSTVTGRSLAKAMVTLGAALALVASGMGLERALAPAPVAATSASAPADRQAGNYLGFAGSPAQQPASVPGATAPALAAPDKQVARAVAIHIPRLKVNRSLIGLHVLGDGSLSVPSTRQDIGWWSGGPRPGAAGATLLAGHVSLDDGPGVFARLKDMRKGDRVTVDRADHTSAVFQVVGQASYPRSNYPDDVVYRVTGKPSIHLVTCDGRFDTAIGHHEDNLVVFADLVSSGPTKKAGR